jgi:hypothetical protein
MNPPVLILAYMQMIPLRLRRTKETLKSIYHPIYHILKMKTMSRRENHLIFLETLSPLLQQLIICKFYVKIHIALRNIFSIKILQ